MNLLGNSVIVVLFFGYFVTCQENAGTNVAPSLRGCYNDTRYSLRENRLPSTINVLIDIIRKAEDGNPSQDAREISFELLHRFRQDGIRKTLKDIDTSQGLPYSPKGWESYKNKLQLTKITPGNAVNFNNESITQLQACSLHYMISSTIEPQMRDDGDSVCSKVARYTSRIHKRAVNELVELDPSSKSQCPIESGVVYTKWGAVSAGLIIAGLAAGFNKNPIKVDNVTLQNAYASTLAGDIAETALNQVSNTKTVGSKGGWNSTIEPKYYFLENNDRENLYMTDAEIRGGLDGLFFALNAAAWKSKATNLKISQIIDMYYSRGVFNESARACNRKNLMNDIINSEEIVQQSVAYSKLLDDQSQLPYTPNEDTLPTLVSSVTASLRQYISSSLNDLGCSADSEYYERVSTDVLIFVDMTWDYNVVQPILSYILERIDVNKYESSYTIFDGANSNLLVNKTRSLSDFYEYFNQSLWAPASFSFTKAIDKAELIFKQKLNNATDLTGQSTIVLMLPHSTPSSSDNSYFENKRSEYKSALPDLRIIVAGSGSQSSYNSLVTSSTSDIFTVVDDIKSNEDTIKKIIERFQKIPRSVVNPKCGSSFSSDGGQNFDVVQYVEPNGINYHRISPNYFYEGQTLKIRGQGYGTLTVCTSRTEVNPKDNSTSTKCEEVNSNEISIDISSYCTDESVTECSPIYISVKGTSTNSVKCTDALCRFPDNIKYTIALENVQCSSSGKHLISSLVLIFFLFVAVRF